MQRPREILNMTVEELLAREPGAAQVLGGYGIDLCRCYALSLRAAARASGADPAVVAGALLFRDAPAQVAAALLVHV